MYLATGASEEEELVETTNKTPAVKESASATTTSYMQLVVKSFRNSETGVGAECARITGQRAL